MPAHAAYVSVAGVTVFPDFGAVGDAAELKAVIGALLTIVLVIAVLMMIICGIVWAISSAAGNHSSATRARIGLWVAAGAAALAGAAVAWMNWLIHLGGTL